MMNLEGTKDSYSDSDEMSDNPRKIRMALLSNGVFH